MKRYLILFVLLAGFIPAIFLQAQPKFIINQPHGKVLAPAIDYITEAPIIDGTIDPQVKELPERKFNYIFVDDSKRKPVEISYRIAYGAEFLYLFIDVQSNELVTRDRSYQNGDGLLIMINTPAVPGNKPTEYYWLGFGPREGKDNYKFIWGYNNSFPFEPLSDRTKFAINKEEKKYSYEILLRWEDIPPYHPWATENIAINMGFIKAIGQTGMDFYMLVSDPDPEKVFTVYTLMDFKQPTSTVKPDLFITSDRRHREIGEPIDLTVTGIAQTKAKNTINVKIFAKDKSLI
ncbi:MAG: hypothetical protein JW737_09635, partial [Acidobacteria bacterium]|nr:hypothetical protein [Acidobacteriota bacterium]